MSIVQYDPAKGLNKGRTNRENRNLQATMMGQGDNARPVYSVKTMLDEAHKHGLVSIQTELLFAEFRKEERPGRNGGNSWSQTVGEAIVRATVTFEDGSVFQAIGDATPSNTTGPVSTAFVRMAETRAVGRALGAALNLDSNAEEEFKDSSSVMSNNQAGQSSSYRGQEAPAQTSRYAPRT